ncbi:hypothetical protein M407DRAFT_9983 [Tulasnella calospora MUT 4182]|uniref:HECT domain-containing protein n=1 Tax=Tulasnella calospora MUT 4182 TaxID=1051891 RepID=A0A0C3KLZ1_9AGAM|nr:hypothetical protein M407DRAFT_9983 [Tulasnella calospora MUT 4182]
MSEGTDDAADIIEALRMVRRLRAQQSSTAQGGSGLHQTERSPGLDSRLSVQATGSSSVASLPCVTAFSGFNSRPPSDPVSTIPSSLPSTIPIPSTGNASGLRSIPSARFSADARSRANQGRVQAAAAHRNIGRQPGRSNQQVPSLGRSSVIADQRPRHVNVEVILYPSIEHSPDPHPPAHYRRYHEFIDHMQDLHRVLIWPEVHLDTGFDDLVRRATREFEDGPLEAHFQYPAGPNNPSHLALALLTPWNRGRETGDPPTRRLRFCPTPGGVMLRDVIYRNALSPQIAAGIAVGRELNWDPVRANTWILRLTPVNPEVHCHHPSMAPDARRPVCNGSCVYTGWTTDNPEELHPLPPDRSSPPADLDDGNDTVVLENSPQQVELQLRGPPPSPRPQIEPLGAIWATPFQESQTTLPRVTNIPAFVQAAQSHATNPNFPGRNLGLRFTPIFSIRATSVKKGADEYQNIICRCYGDRDATMLITPNRTFERVPPTGEPSSGEGVEREYLQELISRYFTPSHNLQPRYGEVLAFQPSTDDLRVPSTDAELRDAWVIGVLVTLTLLRLGHLPVSFSPLQWLLAINRGNINCLTREVMEEFAPTLLEVLDGVEALGPSGDLTQFRSFYVEHLDFDVGRLRNRDEISHTALIPFTLSRALFGPSSFDHPQMVAFMDGVSLQCENGFSVAELAHAFTGGSIALLQRSIEGRITQPEDLAAIIDIVEPPQSYVQQLHSIPDHDLSTFGDFIYQFLRGTGWPSLAKADDLRSLTNITDEEIANPGFRSQTFHRAAFNRDLILAGTRIRITFVGTSPHDISSLPLDVRRNMANGNTILWRTCLGTVYVPATTILQLLRTDYPDEVGFASAEQAIEHWLLCEVSTAARGGIGGVF